MLVLTSTENRNPLPQLPLIFTILAAAFTPMHARAQSFNCSSATSADEVLTLV
jgi:hypothetical protein